jgi:hypothetical protein
MKERGNYETIEEVTRLYTKKICSCLDLFIMSIYEHIMLNMLTL